MSLEERGGKSIYIMVKRLCTGLATKLEGDAKKWWGDHDSQY